MASLTPPPAPAPDNALPTDALTFSSSEAADRLSRASHVFAVVLGTLRPGPGVSPAQMRQHFAEQILDPERYHEIGELPNLKGLRIGDQVLRGADSDDIHYVTSIVRERRDDEEIVRVHTISAGSYGGWCDLAAVRRPSEAMHQPQEAETAPEVTQGPPTPVEPLAQEVTPAAEGTTKAATITATNAARRSRQAARNERAMVAAEKWGFTRDSLQVGPDGVLTPQFDRTETFIQMSEAGCNVRIDVAQAPNGTWANAVHASDKQNTFETELLPTGSGVPYPTLEAAVHAALRQLNRRLNHHVFGLLKQTALTKLRFLARSSLATRAPDVVEKARLLALNHINASGDLFGTAGIHLLSGQGYRAQRMELLRLLDEDTELTDRAATVEALCDAFCEVAGIDDASPHGRALRLEQWLRGQPTQAQNGISTSAQNNDTPRAHEIAGAPPTARTSAAPERQENFKDIAQLPAPESQSFQGAKTISEWVRLRLASERSFNAGELFTTADKAFGGSIFSGRYSSKDAYDAMEAGVNQAIIDARLSPDGSAETAWAKLQKIERLLACLPTQNRRTAETEAFDQFSTVPTLAFVAAWAANIQRDELVLEPSAGTGAHAIHGLLAGARVIVNELSTRRAEILRQHWPQWDVRSENAEQLHNVLPPELQPSVILMNPPFSATGGRTGDMRSHLVIEQHLKQAVLRLAPGGRLVAVVSENMSPDRTRHAQCWSEIMQSCRLRANIAVDGHNYAKYGTVVDVRLLVLDKTGPHDGVPVAASVRNLADAVTLLEEIRNDRIVPTQAERADTSPEPGSRSAAPIQSPVHQRSRSGVTDALGSGERAADLSDIAGQSGPGPDVGDDRAPGDGRTQRSDRLPDPEQLTDDETYLDPQSLAMVQTAEEAAIVLLEALHNSMVVTRR
ncbi:MAG: class I SAM-dependent methyltransferase [Pseudomonadota bacterium]